MNAGRKTTVKTTQLVSILLVALLLAGCAPAAPAAAPTPTAVVDSVTAAIQEAVAAHTSGGGGAAPFRMRVEGIEGDYARVTLVPNNPQTMEGGTLFLQRKEGGWQVIIAGSAFMPEELDALGIPAALRGSN
jgi:hypothetical protein